MGNPYTCREGGRGGGVVFGGVEVVDGADVFSGQPCIQAWPGGSCIPLCIKSN